ncbi:hypothetical protein HanIR_Chr09g0433701 [Helianthus annuus]|nr:hypothetical protein HanIR_Chr09g0433701 [Helianthus annuus]
MSICVNFYFICYVMLVYYMLSCHVDPRLSRLPTTMGCSLVSPPVLDSFYGA